MLAGDCALHLQRSLLNILNQPLSQGSFLWRTKEHNVYITYAVYQSRFIRNFGVCAPSPMCPSVEQKSPTSAVAFCVSTMISASLDLGTAASEAKNISFGFITVTRHLPMSFRTFHHASTCLGSELRPMSRHPFFCARSLINSICALVASGAPENFRNSVGTSRHCSGKRPD
jgi:hypothetical protein